MLSNRFEMRVPYRLYEEIKVVAESEGVSMAEYIKDLIKADLVRREEGK